MKGIHPKRPFPHEALYALAAVLIWSVPSSATSGGDLEKRSPPLGVKSQYVYYPTTAHSFYDYQSTGAFAGRPMVIPPSIPVVTQPAYLYMEAPQPSIIQAPLPVLETRKQAKK
ncbi:MAG: hypothetical protein HQL93_06175 [Magnetococcales bacterium]|nr:hypothetical protein [Magnetococcales bacterium]